MHTFIHSHYTPNRFINLSIDVCIRFLVSFSQSSSFDHYVSHSSLFSPCSTSNDGSDVLHVAGIPMRVVETHVK